MDTRWSALLIVLGLAVAAYPTLGAPFGPPTTRAYTLTATAMPCAEGVCLAYNGQIPGPMLDVNAGDTLVITLRNEIASTIASVTSDADLIARLSAASVSWHVHGTTLPATEDGVAAHEGTKLVESVAHPGGSFTYHVKTTFNGSWHYHDHVLGLDGSEGVRRGLYGGLIVRTGAEPRADAVLDMHLLDITAQGKRPAHMSVREGESFEVLFACLENLIWSNVQLRAPSGATLGSVTLGPGMSERLRVDDALPGTYTIRGFGRTIGTIEVVPQ